MRGAFARSVGICLLVSCPLSSDAAGCPPGKAGECSDDGCCTDDQQVTWNLTALAGDKDVAGPQAGPVGKKYRFNLLSNVVDPPQVCQVCVCVGVCVGVPDCPLYRSFPPTKLRSPLGEQEFDPPLVEFNALEYDDSTNKTDDLCKAIGCNIDPFNARSWEGLHVKHIVGSRPGEYLGLRFDYMNPDLGDSFLTADLVCLALFPLSDMSACNTDAVR